MELKTLVRIGKHPNVLSFLGATINQGMSLCTDIQHSMTVVCVYRQTMSDSRVL